MTTSKEVPFTTLIISCPMELAKDRELLATMSYQAENAFKLYERGERFNPYGWCDERKDTVIHHGQLWMSRIVIELKKRKKTLYISIKREKEKK